MAAPPEMTLRTIDGIWNMNRTLSDSLEATLSLQGMNIFMRKIVCMSNVTVSIKSEHDSEGITHMDITQTTSGKSIVEKRVLDWSPRESQSPLLGKLEGRSEWSSVAKLTSGEHNTINGEDTKESTDGDDEWLVSEWESGETDGSGDGEVLHAFVKGAGGWTMEQVWGFQVVGGEKKYVRRMVTRKGKEVVRCRLVYDWVAKE